VVDHIARLCQTERGSELVQEQRNPVRELHVG
jgi:hypothetical protein